MEEIGQLGNGNQYECSVENAYRNNSETIHRMTETKGMPNDIDKIRNMQGNGHHAKQQIISVGFSVKNFDCKNELMILREN